MADISQETITRLLRYADECHATDLHFCVGSAPLVRLNGRLEPVPGEPNVSPALVDEVVNSLLEGEKRERLERQRSLDFSFSVPGLGRYRCNIYSQRGTYAVAMRMLPFDVPELGGLGLPESVGNFVHKNKGLMLVVGPTGSGKSTTLASLVGAINEQYPYHILTIEDPLEYLHRHRRSLVTQREVGADTQSFAAALREALREDPDVILVGEMRDPETIGIALTAAETGHLVLSTLHTAGAAKTMDRIVDSFSNEQQNQARAQLATVLCGVISQQLIPRLDGQGMVLASEVLVATPAVRNLIREGKHYQLNSIIQTGAAMGMQSMEMDLARLVKEGVIAKDEALVRAQDAQLLTQLLNRR